MPQAQDISIVQLAEFKARDWDWKAELKAIAVDEQHYQRLVELVERYYNKHYCECAA